MIFMEGKELASYLTVRSKIFIQSYAARMNFSIEEVGIPLLPPGVKQVGREGDSCLVMQAKRGKILS